MWFSGSLVFRLQLHRRHSHSCAKTSSGAATFQVGKPQPDPSLPAASARRQHGAREQRAEVTTAGEDLPLSLMAKFRGASESRARLPGRPSRRRAPRPSLKRDAAPLCCSRRGRGAVLGAACRASAKLPHFPEGATIVCKSQFL